MKKPLTVRFSPQLQRRLREASKKIIVDRRTRPPGPISQSEFIRRAVESKLHQVEANAPES